MSSSNPPPRLPSPNLRNSLVPVEVLLERLLYPNLRSQAIIDLCKGKDSYRDLALRLWHSPSLIAVLLQEIIQIYPLLTPSRLSPTASGRACNAIALLQVIASHPDTRILFLHAQMPLYLFPFLYTTGGTREVEDLRLTSLGAIGALVKVSDATVISALLQAEIMPLCLHNMDNASRLAKTVATYIMYKILANDIGLQYTCARAERFFALCSSLQRMVVALTKEPSAKLLKQIIYCYIRLADEPRASKALQSILPIMLRDGTFDGCLADDQTTWIVLQQLIVKVS